MACDLGKGTAHDLGEGPQPGRFRRLRIQSLADNVALLTAYSNDLSYEDVYVEQLKTLLAPGDVAIGISGSGGSPNVLRALAYARSAGAVTIGFTGSQATSVLLCQLCDIAVQAPLMMMEQIEDIHVMLHHAITVCLRQRIGAHCRAAALAAASAGAP
jgi:D-sedoheptulose 7-phosphate isomerase